LSFGTNHLSIHYSLWGNSLWYTSMFLELIMLTNQGTTVINPYYFKYLLSSRHWKREQFSRVLSNYLLGKLLSSCDDTTQSNITPLTFRRTLFIPWRLRYYIPPKRLWISIDNTTSHPRILYISPSWRWEIKFYVFIGN
jgi:hypothetical protein